MDRGPGLSQCCGIQNMLRLRIAQCIMWHVVLAGGLGGALAALISGTVFASIVPESFSKEELNSMRPYNHPVNGYNRTAQTQGSGPQGAVFANNVSRKNGQYGALLSCA